MLQQKLKMFFTWLLPNVYTWPWEFNKTEWQLPAATLMMWVDVNEDGNLTNVGAPLKETKIIYLRGGNVLNLYY